MKRSQRTTKKTSGMFFRPEEVLFSLTTECNLNCGHCSVDKHGGRLSAGSAVRFLKGAKLVGIKRVGFTGGEPFLNLNVMCAIVRDAVKNGFFFDRIMTNGVWFASDKDLKGALKKLRSSGYDGDICVSIDAFHRQEARKLARFIKMAVRIWNRPDVISVAYVSGAGDSMTGKKIHRVRKLLGGGAFLRLLRIDLSRAGKSGVRGSAWTGSWFKDDFCRGPGNTLHLMPNGDVKPCCGYSSDMPELTIGNARFMTASGICKNLRNNRFAVTVFSSGLGAIRKRLEKKGFEFPGKTRDHCFFCGYLLTEVPKDLLKGCLD